MSVKQGIVSQSSFLIVKDSPGRSGRARATPGSDRCRAEVAKEGGGQGRAGADDGGWGLLGGGG